MEMRRAIDYGLIIRAKTFASILLTIITAKAHSQQPVPTSLAAGFRPFPRCNLALARPAPKKLLGP
jgi:hypothetical protein